MRQLLTFSTWVIVRLAKPYFPDGHMMKKNVSLKDWADHSTPLNDYASAIFWVFFIIMLATAAIAIVKI